MAVDKKLNLSTTRDPLKLTINRRRAYLGMEVVAKIEIRNISRKIGVTISDYEDIE